MRKGFVFLFLLSGCATGYKSVQPKDAGAEKSVAMGKAHVSYNGKVFTENCSICMNSINGPCQTLDKDGWFVFPLDPGKHQLRRLACHDVSAQHHNFNEVHFELLSAAGYYVGDIYFDWQNKGGFKVSSMFGLVGALADESSNDGKIQIKVLHSEKSRRELDKLYSKQLKRTDAPLKTRLIEIQKR